MQDIDTEAKFEEYRKYLYQEVARLTRYIRVYRLLQERYADRFNEINMAPAFFETVKDALFSVIVVWVHKLFDENSERGLFNFLTFCEYHRSIFETQEFQRRLLQQRPNYIDKDWMLDTESITFEIIQKDKGRIAGLGSLQKFKHRRDKFHAHFDKDYFFNREKLSKGAPLKWSDLEELVTVMKEIINRYSIAYDGAAWSLEPINVTDLDNLLNYVHWTKKRDA